MKVKCNKCGHIGDAKDFPKSRDLFQRIFISSCPKKCGNTQNPGDASMRMFGGNRPFETLRPDAPDDPIGKTLHNAGEIS